jgi:hypothetical protein
MQPNAASWEEHFLRLQVIDNITYLELFFFTSVLFFSFFPEVHFSVWETLEMMNSNSLPSSFPEAEHLLTYYHLFSPMLWLGNTLIRKTPTNAWSGAIKWSDWRKIADEYVVGGACEIKGFVFIISGILGNGERVMSDTTAEQAGPSENVYLGFEQLPPKSLLPNNLYCLPHPPHSPSACQGTNASLFHRPSLVQIQRISHTGLRSLKC